MEWVERLLTSKYFEPCETHPGIMTNIFHIDSGCTLCPACAAKHSPASLLQARRGRRSGRHIVGGRALRRRQRAARARDEQTTIHDPAGGEARRARARPASPRRAARAAATWLSVADASRRDAGPADSALLVP